MRLCLSTLLIVFMSFTCKSQQGNVNVLDSNSINIFISQSDICQQIQAAQKFTPDIAGEKGYGVKVLEALSKSTGYRFYLPIATGSIVLTKSQRVDALKEQLNELQWQKQCSSK